MKHITVHGWVGKWDSGRKYMFSAIDITTDPKNVVLFYNERGAELTKPKETYDCDNLEFLNNNNGIELRSRSIGQNGPKFGAMITGTRYEVDLEEKEYNRLKKYLEEV